MTTWPTLYVNSISQLNKGLIKSNHCRAICRAICRDLFYLWLIGRPCSFLRDLHSTSVISVFMISRLYYSLFLNIQLPTLKWKSIQNIVSSQRHSLQPTIPHPLYPILSSAATLNTAKNGKNLFSFPVLSRGGDNLPKGWLHSMSFGSPNSSNGQLWRISLCQGNNWIF